MAIPKPITRVEQYLASIAGASDVTLPAYPITREEYYLASWAEKSGFEIAEVDGTPPLVLKDCIGEQFKGLVLYGKSTQVTTTGAQLLDIPDYTGISRGVTVTVKEGLISLHGTCTETGWILIERVTPVSLDGVYILSVYGADKRVTLATEKYSGIMTSGSASTVNNSIAKRIAFSANKGEVLNVDGIKVMLNAGDTAFPWEPYTGGKPSPSPDYPQEIVSAGDDGSIGIEVHGKNIFGGRYYYANYANNILIINGNRKEEEVKLPYAPKYESFGVCKVIKCKKGKTYVISVTNPNKNATIGMAEYENIENASAYTKNVGFARMTNKTKQLYTAKSDGILVCGIAGTWTDGKTTVHECTESELLQVEEASEATSYEPYHNPQTLTLSTPNGLPGIMVTSSGNYTDENGQQWICDEVDFERGVYRQRIKHVNVVFKKGASSSTHSGYRHMAGDIKNLSREYTECLCNIATYSRDAANGKEGIRASGGYNALVLYYENLTNDTVPANVAYILSDPIETPLSETDIAAYRALTTYKGTTILESECYLKVKYSKLRK